MSGKFPQETGWALPSPPLPSPTPSLSASDTPSGSFGVNAPARVTEEGGRERRRPRRSKTATVLQPRPLPHATLAGEHTGRQAEDRCRCHLQKGVRAGEPQAWLWSNASVREPGLEGRSQPDGTPEPTSPASSLTTLSHRCAFHGGP